MLELICAGLLHAVATGAPLDEPPHILLMLTDNVGYGDLGCYGNREIRTPAIDRLAREGVRCTDFYIGSPSCMPSRGALLTGRHPVRNGLNEQIWRIDEREQEGLSREEWILPRYLKPRGYATACFGKWNIGFARGSRPTDRGFDEYFGNISGNCDYYTHIYNGRNDLYRGTEPVEVEGYTTDLFAGAACDFLRRRSRQPCFVYLAFNAAHYPNRRNKKPGDPVIWQAPRKYFGIYGDSPEVLDERKRYRAVLSALDAGIGRVLGQIDDLGLRERTVVILLSDNGAFMLPGRGLECASNRPLKGGGVTVHEGGVRVPCILRWPGRFGPGTVCREPLVSMDLAVLALRASGAPLPVDRVLDGRDPIPALSGGAKSPHQYLYFRWGNGSAIRSGRYKLIRTAGSQPWELYDLATDVGETRNLASRRPEVVDRLGREFERWFADARRRRE